MNAYQIEALKTISKLQARLDSIRADIRRLEREGAELRACLADKE